MERLQKLIAQAGIASRRKAETLILEGRVTINGNIVKELGTKASSKDIIEVDGKPLNVEEKEYYLLNKPRGIITSTKDEKGRDTVIDLIDTTAALLLTNDGEFANILMQPANEIDKVYLAKLEGIITKEAIQQLKDGVLIDKSKVKASRVKLKKVDSEKNTCLVEITIHEGKNHQVKKMFEAVGFHVEKLTRKRIGNFQVNDLKSGEYRKLTPKEVQIVYSYKKSK